MNDLEPEPNEPELDALLRRSRPAPDRAWIDDLERRLLPLASARPAWWRLPHVRLGAAIAVGLAALLLTLGLGGVGPLGGKTDNVRAKDDCELVRVTRVEQVPVLVEGADGKTKIIHRSERVQRFERRCR